MSAVAGRILLAGEGRVEALADAVDPRYRALVLLLRHTGIRVGELVTLKVRDVSLSDRKGSLRVFGKGAKERTIPLNQTVRGALAAYLAESDKFETLIERAKRADWRLVRPDDAGYRAHVEAARRDLLEELQALRIETIEEFDSLLQQVLETDPGFIERFSKHVKIMPDQILALAVGHLRREELGHGSAQRHPVRSPVAATPRVSKGVDGGEVGQPGALIVDVRSRVTRPA